MRLKLTTPFPGWTPGRVFVRSGRPAKFMNTGAPPPSVPRFQRALHARASDSTGTRWTRSGFGLRVARLDPLARACRLGGAGFAHLETAALGRDYHDGDGLRPACGFEAAPPAVRRPVGRVRLTGLRLDARPAVPLRFARCQWPSTPPPGLRQGLRACGLPEQPPRADSLRQTAWARWPLATSGLVAKPYMPPLLCL